MTMWIPRTGSGAAVMSSAQLFLSPFHRDTDADTDTKSRHGLLFYPYLAGCVGARRVTFVNEYESMSDARLTDTCAFSSGAGEG